MISCVICAKLIRKLDTRFKSLPFIFCLIFLTCIVALTLKRFNYVFLFVRLIFSYSKAIFIQFTSPQPCLVFYDIFSCKTFLFHDLISQFFLYTNKIFKLILTQSSLKITVISLSNFVDCTRHKKLYKTDWYLLCSFLCNNWSTEQPIYPTSWDYRDIE